jgi:hypothetical protein
MESGSLKTPAYNAALEPLKAAQRLQDEADDLPAEAVSATAPADAVVRRSERAGKRTAGEADQPPQNNDLLNPLKFDSPVRYQGVCIMETNGWSSLLGTTGDKPTFVADAVAGFVPVSDVRTMRQRSSDRAWRYEMLCNPVGRSRTREDIRRRNY